MAAPKSQAQKGTQKKRMLDGKVVRGVLYNGKALGHGKFMAAEVDGQFVTDQNGCPLPWKLVGQLV